MKAAHWVLLAAMAAGPVWAQTSSSPQNSDVGVLLGYARKSTAVDTYFQYALEVIYGRQFF